MNAAEARKAQKDWLAKVTKENMQWNKNREAKEAHISAILWKKRSTTLIKQIDGYIIKASANGSNGIWEPSEINPHGDPIIWLSETDRPIHKMLIKHYRDKGFKVEEFTPIAMKISW